MKSEIPSDILRQVTLPHDDIMNMTGGLIPYASDKIEKQQPPKKYNRNKNYIQQKYLAGSIAFVKEEKQRNYRQKMNEKKTEVTSQNKFELGGFWNAVRIAGEQQEEPGNVAENDKIDAVGKVLLHHLGLPGMVWQHNREI